MKSHYASALKAIALALPLGIGGLAVTAPVTSTEAEGFEVSGQEDPYRYGTRWDTCSVETIWRCDRRVQSKILFDSDYRKIFEVDPLPHGANGADQATYERLVHFIEIDWNGPELPKIKLCCGAGEISILPEPGSWRDDLVKYLREFYPDDEVRSYNETANEPFVVERDLISMDADVHFGYRLRHISPRELARFEEFVAGNKQVEVNADRNRRRNILESQDEEMITELLCGDVEGDYLVGNPNFGTPPMCWFNPDQTVVHPSQFTYYFDDPNEDNIGRLNEYHRDLYNISDVAMQITQIEPFGGLADIADPGDHRQATSDHRDRIVELQELVVEHGEILQELEPTVARNVQIIQALGNSVGVLSEAVAGLAMDAEKNTAGIALAYALDAPGLSQGRRFAITGALGQFRGESAVGFSGTFRAGQNVLISVGGGFAGSGDASVTGGRASATYEW